MSGLLKEVGKYYLELDYILNKLFLRTECTHAIKHDGDLVPNSKISDDPCSLVHTGD